MIILIRRWIQFQIKSIEFKFRTWKNAYKIFQAYSLTGKRGKASFLFSKKIQIVVVLVVAVVFFAGVTVTMFKSSKINFIRNPEAAIVNNDHVKRAQNKLVNTNKEKNYVQKEINRVEAMINSLKLPGRDTIVSSSDSVPDSLVRKMPLVDASIFVYDTTAKPVSDTVVDFMVLIANKANHVLYLLQKKLTRKWSVVRTYYIGHGAQSGRKVTAGDKRTPEGLYIIVDRKERHQLASIYGPLAYVLDYPNQADRAEGRTGQGIWIHGTETDSLPGETKGCLELNNSDLIDLSLLLKAGRGTPIFIVNDSLLKDPKKVIDTSAVTLRRKALFDTAIVAMQKLTSTDSAVALQNLPALDTALIAEYEQASSDTAAAVKLKQPLADSVKVKQSAAQRDLLHFVTEWVTAWESQNIEEYSKFYHHSKFSAKGMNWVEWKDKKEKTFSLYDTINVTYGKIGISNVTENSAVLKFSQSYSTEKVTFKNYKQLDLEKEQGLWKITREAAF